LSLTEKSDGGRTNGAALVKTGSWSRSSERIR
jgi:hypothetical protein